MEFYTIGSHRVRAVKASGTMLCDGVHVEKGKWAVADLCDTVVVIADEVFQKIASKAAEKPATKQKEVASGTKISRGAGRGGKKKSAGKARKGKRKDAGPSTDAV